MTFERIKVLYIAGWGRSGSTILGNILGGISGFCHAGELRLIWDRGMVQNQLCGCGVPFKECSFWNSIVGRVFGSWRAMDAESMIRMRDQISRSRHIPLMMHSLGRKLFRSQIATLTQHTEKLYLAIRDVTGCRVIVDSSHHPAGLYACMSTSRKVQYYILHLIRDSRATAFSWNRHRLDPASGDYMLRIGSLKSSLLWSLWNFSLETLANKYPHKYLQIRYEDFARQPRRTVDQVVGLLQESVHGLQFHNESTLQVSPHHSIGGNPARFRVGEVKISLDEEWRSRMRWHDDMLVTVLTWPLLLRYGYTLGR